MRDPRGIDVARAILEYAGVEPVVDFEAMRNQHKLEHKVTVGTGYWEKVMELDRSDPPKPHGIGHDFNVRCGCPGCQFMFAGMETFRRIGPPPLIGTFEPKVGDYGRYLDTPTAQWRVYMGDGEWWPSYAVSSPLRGPA